MLRNRLLALAAFLGSLVLLAAMIWRGLHEQPGTNTFALLADAFLHGRFHFSGCFDNECVEAVKGSGRNFLVQPPFPAVIAMPFVAAYGTQFHGFILLAVPLVALTLLIWWRIFGRLGTDTQTRAWLIMALFASTPLAYATLRSDGVWLFAHVVGFLAATIAIHEAMAGRLVTSGLALGAAFLSRQLSLTLLPFLLAISLTVEARILPPSRETIVKALRLGFSFAVAVAFYLYYNWSRYGLPMETGHSILAAQAPYSKDLTIVTLRLRDIGVFSKEYIPFNFFYMFLQGFHAEFSGPLMTKLSGLDPAGASFLAASPFLLFLFFTPRDRTIWFGLMAIVPIIALLLVYHSNGFKQYNVHRYILDFLPVLMVFIARAVRPDQRPVFGLLVTWGIAMNIAMVAVLAITRG